MSKLYFIKGAEEEGCREIKSWPKEYPIHLEDGEAPDITFVEAKIEYGTEYFWCSHWGASYLKEDRFTCGKICSEYAPRNGKSGRCRHNKNCYEITDKYFKLKNGRLKRVNNGTT